MYRGGLTTRRIAELVGVPHSTVHYHLRVARAADPDLERVHPGAVTDRPARVTARGLELMQELLSMVEKIGRYPYRNAKSAAERSLACGFSAA